MWRLLQLGIAGLLAMLAACKAVTETNEGQTPVAAIDSTFIPALNSLPDSLEGIVNFERFGSVTFAVIGNSKNYFVYESFLHGNATFLSKYRVDEGAFCNENRQYIGNVDANCMNTLMRLIDRIPESMLDCKEAITCNVCMSCPRNNIVYVAYTGWGLTEDCPKPAKRQFYLDLNSDHLTEEQRAFAIEVIKRVAVLDYCQVITK